MDGYEYTHITWRAVNDDGGVTTYVNTIHDRERAADEIKELAMMTHVFALRAIQYPMAGRPPTDAVPRVPSTSMGCAPPGAQNRKDHQ
jgi:hypothetical protein